MKNVKSMMHSKQMNKQTFWCHTRCEGKSLFQSSTHQEVFYYEKL